MKTTLTYGFYSALAGALLTLAFYFAGFHESPEKMETAHNAGIVLGLIIGIAVLIFGIKEKRELTPSDASWGYGSALGTGVLIGLFAALMIAVFNYCYFAFINPGFTDVVFQAQVAKMEAKGLSATQIEQAEPIMRKFMSPVAMTISGFIIGLVANTVLSLILAAFLKNRPAGAQPPVAS